MRDIDEFRDLLLKLGRERADKSSRVNRFRESVVTKILGVLSVLIGLVVLIWPVAAGVPFPGLRVLQSPVTNPSLGSTPRVVFALTAIVGECLGIAGVMVARSRGRLLSPLCVLGTVLCVLHMAYFVAPYILVLCFIVVLMPMLYFGARIVQNKISWTTRRDRSARVGWAHPLGSGRLSRANAEATSADRRPEA